MTVAWTTRSVAAKRPGRTCDRVAADTTYRFAFVLDQQVGLRTQALNVEAAAAADPAIRSTFVPVAYAADAGPLTRLPFLPAGARGTLRGVREIRSGLGDASRYDAILWATWAAKAVPDLLRAAPAFLRMDMTPTQMAAMGAEYGYSRARAWLGGGWKRRATRRAYLQAAHLFPWSRYVASSLIEDYGVPAERITVVSPGTDTERFHPDPAMKSMDGTVRVLFVGGDFVRKGGDLLLRWMDSRHSAEPPVELHVVTRTEVPGRRGLVVHRDVTNNCLELAQLYRQCDIFALPTKADCYSLVALEAMASGLPVVISDIGGISDIVADGATGYLIPPGDESAFLRALESLVRDAARRADFGALGRRRACTEFDHRACLTRILNRMKESTLV